MNTISEKMKRLYYNWVTKPNNQVAYLKAFKKKCQLIKDSVNKSS